MKKISLLVLIFAVLSLGACGEEESSSDIIIEQSFDDEADDWKPSLLSKAGLEYLEEPEGEKVFTKEENGDFSFTLTPADEKVLSNLVMAIQGKISNLCDDYKITPDEENKSSDIEYTYGNSKVFIKLTLSGNVLTAKFEFN